VCDAEDLTATRPQIGQHRNGHGPRVPRTGNTRME
jgi:hypothetical protein